jgi:nicotinamide-nucleotide adenylyltransferase
MRGSTGQGPAHRVPLTDDEDHVTGRCKDTDWRTKPTDRFLLRWIKVNLSARITPCLTGQARIRPWMITLASAMLGVTAGVIFALGYGWVAGFIAAMSQVADGVDGQYSRLTVQHSAAGAFWDSVLDRYSDGALVIGTLIYLFRLPVRVPTWSLMLLGSMAIIGSNLVSYSTSRAENLGIDLGRPTLASKGTRTSVIVVCGWMSYFLPGFPLIAVAYLALHPSVVVVGRLAKALRATGPAQPPVAGHGPCPATEIIDTIETGVIHGRFQVLHNDHLKYLMAGKQRCRRLVVGITNPDPSLTRTESSDPNRSSAIANPLTYYERYLMIRQSLMEAGLDVAEFSIVPLPINLPELYRYYVPMDAMFFLTIYDDWGRRKLERFRSLGLQTEVLWEKPPDEKGISASEVRRRMAEGEPWEGLVPPATRRLMEEWDIPGRLRKMI